MFWFITIVLLILFTFLVTVRLSLPKRLPFDPAGKHCLVTGGSRGIGKAVGAELLCRGCRALSLVARDPIALELAKKELEEYLQPGQSVRTYPVDLADEPDKIEAVVREAERHAGAVDLLVNNAGTCVQGAFDELPNDAFERQLRTNFLSAVHVTRAVVGDMKRRRFGHISFVCSAAGQLAIWGYSAYSPSKFALRGFADALHMELLPWNVGVSILFPPNTATDGFREELRTMTPQIRAISGTAGLYQPRDVAERLVCSIRGGHFATTIGLEGWMLGVLSASTAPEPDSLRAFLQILLAGLFRGVFLLYGGHFNRLLQNEPKLIALQALSDLFAPIELNLLKNCVDKTFHDSACDSTQTQCIELSLQGSFPTPFKAQQRGSGTVADERKKPDNGSYGDFDD
uniref:3-dehydrosphinganine reductase n=1 Tax=Globodera rostochiensis TaxID=31243 RepID=A0A914H9X2_GLORO